MTIEQAELSNAWFEREFATTRVMAILRGLGGDRSLEISERAWALGVTAVELPIQSADDVAALRLVADAGRDRGMRVGAGTVVRPEQVRVAAEAGAAFTVSPGFDAEVVRASLEAGLPTMPGVATPSDVQRATREGLGWLKAFPAAQLTPAWIRVMHGPFPAVRFVATGGVTPENAAAFLDAGCSVVALGSALADSDALETIRPLVQR